MDEVTAWQSRPLDTVYPIVYLDALVVRSRAPGMVQNKSVYLALGTELNNRGLQDILVACVDGLNGYASPECEPY